ncbi:glycosyltransferase family 2 protein [Ornithobacterium rhinotracheale]|uniref:glycosyltransferase family 2 protein n=1 Tax=Ornithobacterium rhinotracheale TaxID=28251 RepID=UPI003FA4686B
MISVIVPIYNSDRYLRQCLESIQNQTFQDFEVILINDGSSDNSQSICEEFTTNDDRFKLINQENKGLSEARNIGLQQASRDYICFVDSDDWLELDMLELLHSDITKENADISCCGYYVAKPNKNIPIWHQGDSVMWNRKEALSKLLINKEMKDFAWAKLYKKELFDGITFPPGKYFEDIFTTYKVFSKANKIVKTNQSKYYYREHINSVTASQTACLQKELNLFEATYDLYLFAKNNPDSLENPAQVKAGIAKLIYRIKKQTISRFDLKSDDYKLLDNKINPVLRLILKENSPFSIGLQRYIGIIISLHYPFLFKLKSLFK